MQQMKTQLSTVVVSCMVNYNHTHKQTDSELKRSAIRRNWVKRDLPINNLVDTIIAGFSVMPALLKPDSKDLTASSVDSTELLAVDYDDKSAEGLPVISLKEFLESDLVEYCFAVVASPSTKIRKYDKIYDFRVWYRLDERIYGSETVEKYYQTLVNISPCCDKSCKNPNRWFFGSNGDYSREEALFYNNYSAVLPKQYLESFFVNTTSIKKVHANSSRTSEINQIIYKFLIEPLEDDISLLFDRYEHNFREVTPDNPNIVRKFVGCNPWHPSTTGLGDSFKISLMSDYTVVFVDLANGNSGTLWDYYSLLDIGEKIPPSDYNIYWGYVNSLFEKYNIENPFKKNELPKPVVLFGQFLEEYTGLVYYNPDEDIFHIYKENHWTIINDREFKILIRQWSQQKYYCPYGFTAPYIQQLTQIIKVNTPIDKKLQHDRSHVPFRNGLFNLKTKTLCPFTPTVKNIFVFDYDYVFDLKKQFEAINLFQKLLSIIVKDPRCIADVIRWISAVTQYKGYETRVALGLVGDPNSGKSTITNWIANMLSPINTDIQIVKYLKAHTLLKEGERFATLKLRGTALSIITEFNGLPSNSDGSLLKDLIGDSEYANGSRIDMELKGGRTFTEPVLSGFITNSQTFPKLPYDDEGWNRRFIWCTINKIDPIKYFVSEWGMVDSMIPDLLSWFVNQDCDKIIHYFRNDFNPEWIKEVKKEFNQANDPYYRFVEDSLEYSEGSSLTGGEIYLLAKNYFQMSDERIRGFNATRFGKELKRVLPSVIPEWDISQIKKSSTIKYLNLKVKEC